MLKLLGNKLKFEFGVYLCKIPSESPTAFFTPSFPGFRIFSLKVSNALNGILNEGGRGGTSEPLAGHLRSCHPLSSPA